MTTPETETSPAAGTRDRIVRAAADLLQRQGYEATSIKAISVISGATYGSLYHFFPGGKEELGAAALRFGAEDFSALLRRGLAASNDPGAAFAACAQLLADTLRDSEWTDGCPVAATALEMVGRSPLIQRASDEALSEWRSILAEPLLAAGWDAATAQSLAGTALATLEGAELLARVQSDDQPLRDAAGHLRLLVEAVGASARQHT